MNERHKQILRTLTLGPRSGNDFTDGSIASKLSSAAPIHVRRYLRDLVKWHLATVTDRDIYTITIRGRAQVEVQPVAELFCREVYKGQQWQIRDGGQDHLRYKSKGMGV